MIVSTYPFLAIIIVSTYPFLAIIITSVIFYIIIEFYNYHKRYKFFKKHYFDSKKTDSKSNFKELLNKQLEEVQNKKSEIVCTATKCMSCEKDIKKDEGILLCAECGL